MELNIEGKRYRVVFRQIVECSLKEIPPGKGLLANALAKCMPQDRYNLWKGQVQAFKGCMKQVGVAEKAQRKEIWQEFLRKLR